jgi:hypothetical protein
MKKVTLIFTLLAFYGCFEVERDCNAFKTGRFEFKYVLDGVEKTGIFVRTDSLNIDFFEDTADTSSVRWINDCEFVLKKLHPKNMAEEKAIHMKILTTTDTSYTFEYQLAVKESNKAPRVEKGTAIKLKE